MAFQYNLVNKSKPLKAVDEAKLAFKAPSQDAEPSSQSERNVLIQTEKHLESSFLPELVKAQQSASNEKFKSGIIFAVFISFLAFKLWEELA